MRGSQCKEGVDGAMGRSVCNQEGILGLIDRSLTMGVEEKADTPQPCRRG